MKTLMQIVFFILILMVLCSFESCKNNNKKIRFVEQPISISGAFALYPMMIVWTKEYKKLHPEIRFDVSGGGAGKGITDVLSGLVDIGMVSREIHQQEYEKGAYPIAVCKDAVVPTISSKNPVLNKILEKGITQNTFEALFVMGSIKTWGQVIGTSNKQPVRVYTRSDACGAAETWAKYFNKKQEELIGIGVFGDPGLATAIKNDPLGIGYNNIGYAYDVQSKKQHKGLVVVPIDLNNNGKIDEDEKFYNTINDITEAIANNQYPSPPARNLYLVFKNKPQNTSICNFIKWILTEGQKFIHSAGYIKIPDSEIENNLKKLTK